MTRGFGDVRLLLMVYSIIFHKDVYDLRGIMKLSSRLDGPGLCLVVSGLR